MKSRITTKMAVAAIAGTILVTGSGWGTQAVFAASPFSDIANVTWANKHITKLALQGILKGGTDAKGNPNGKFLPNDPVSREQAILIALRFMGVADQVNTSEVLVFPSQIAIGDYYKPYVKLAIQKKIITMTEEVALADKEKGKDWGKSPATREWMTRLLVRAIGKDAQALAAAGATTFSDDSSIDASLKGYVKEAVAEGLVTGISTGTATKFDPKATVTRATASTLFSRAEAKLSVAYSGQVSGTLLSISADKLTVLHQDGSLVDYTVTADTAFYRFDSDASSTLAGLKLYGEATLIVNADKTVAYVEQTNDTPRVKTYEGNYSLHTASKNRITLIIGDDYQDFYYDPAHLPTVADADGKTIGLKDIPQNAAVKLTVDAVRTDGKILSIEVKQSLANKSGSGTVKAWDSVNRTLTVLNSGTSIAETLTVAANATIKQASGINVSDDQLKIGDSISYEVKSGLVTSILIAKPQQSTVTGTVFSVNKTDKTIQYTSGTLQIKQLDDAVVVSISGLSDATLDDLIKGDAVTLTLSDADKVKKVEVTSRSVQTITGAVVGGYLSTTKTLSLLDPSGNPLNLIVGANVRYDLNGTKLTPENGLLYISVPGKKLNIGYTGNNLVSVSIVAQYTGTVTENNTVSHFLKVNTSGTTVVTIPYSTPAVELYGVTNPTFANVLVGDQVTVLLNGAQDAAATIKLLKTFQFEVVSVDSANGKLRVKDSNGTTVEWTVTTALSLQDENGAAISLGSLAPGNLLNVSLSGNTPVVAKHVSVTLGKVVSVNYAAGTVELALYNGTNVTKSVGANPLILRENVAVASLASVQPDDRIEIRKDANDRTVVQIMTGVRESVWYRDTATNTLYVQSASTADRKYYTLAPQAYLHQGTTTIGLTNLDNGDAITVYVLRGKAVEIVK